MKNILFLFCLSFSALTVTAQEIDINELLKETQITQSDAQHLDLIMWMPTEYWQESFAMVPDFPKEEIEVIVGKLDDYLIFACAKADMKEGMAHNFRDPITTVEQFQLSYNNLTMSPLNNEDIDSEVLIILDLMKPALTQMIGDLGANINWVLFNNSGIVQVDAKGDIDLKMTFFEKPYAIPLPLNALLPSKICPTDNESMLGSWKFCPFHGVELTDKN